MVEVVEVIMEASEVNLVDQVVVDQENTTWSWGYTGGAGGVGNTPINKSFSGGNNGKLQQPPAIRWWRWWWLLVVLELASCWCTYLELPKRWLAWWSRSTKRNNRNSNNFHTLVVEVVVLMIPNGQAGAGSPGGNGGGWRNWWIQQVWQSCNTGGGGGGGPLDLETANGPRQEHQSWWSRWFRYRDRKNAFKCRSYFSSNTSCSPDGFYRHQMVVK